MIGEPYSNPQAPLPNPYVLIELSLSIFPIPNPNLSFNISNNFLTLPDNVVFPLWYDGKIASFLKLGLSQIASNSNPILNSVLKSASSSINALYGLIIM